MVAPNRDATAAALRLAPSSPSSPPARLSPAWRAAPLFALALVTTLVAPLWLLLLSPLVFGVPHVVADVRYLLVRPTRPGRAQALALGVPLVALVVLRVVSTLGGPRSSRLEVLGGLAAIVGALVFADGRRRARGLGLVLVAPLATLALARPDDAALVLGHAHNVVALALWLVWSRASARTIVVVAALALGCALVIVVVPIAVGATSAAGLDFAGLVTTLAPGLGASAGTRVVLLFAFAQAMHYAVWLVLLPAADAKLERSRRAADLAGERPRHVADLAGERRQHATDLARQRPRHATDRARERPRRAWWKRCARTSGRLPSSPRRR